MEKFIKSSSILSSSKAPSPTSIGKLLLDPEAMQDLGEGKKGNLGPIYGYISKYIPDSSIKSFAQAVTKNPLNPKKHLIPKTFERSPEEDLNAIKNKIKGLKLGDETLEEEYIEAQYADDDDEEMEEQEDEDDDDQDEYYVINDQEMEEQQQQQEQDEDNDEEDEDEEQEEDNDEEDEQDEEQEDEDDGKMEVEEAKKPEIIQSILGKMTEIRKYAKDSRKAVKDDFNPSGLSFNKDITIIQGILDRIFKVSGKEDGSLDPKKIPQDALAALEVLRDKYKNNIVEDRGIIFNGLDNAQRIPESVLESLSVLSLPAFIDVLNRYVSKFGSTFVKKYIPLRALLLNMMIKKSMYGNYIIQNLIDNRMKEKALDLLMKMDLPLFLHLIKRDLPVIYNQLADLENMRDNLYLMNSPGVALDNVDKSIDLLKKNLRNYKSTLELVRDFFKPVIYFDLETLGVRLDEFEPLIEKIDLNKIISQINSKL